jgi:energy-coupling factor transport system ATP-binding protein
MILDFDNVSYRYPSSPSPTLRGLDLEVAAGETLLIAGASGSGKSTLARAAVGLIPHFHGGELLGRVRVDGLDTRDHPVHVLFAHAGIVFQNPDAQLFNQTVEAELVYGLESLGLESREIERRLAWVSDLTGLGPFLRRPPHSLSGGEKQRVALAAVLALRPGLLLLDEPFTHLDQEGASALRAILAAVRAEGMAVAVAEHRLQELAATVNRLVVLYRGRVGTQGIPREVLGRDLSPFDLQAPPLVRLFREAGLPGVPLTVEEAVLLLDRPEVLKILGGESGHPSRDEKKGGNDRGRPMVEAENVTFGYGDRPVLNGVNLTIREGECVVLVGRNGAGKTTLLRHFMGLLRPREGRVRIMGQDTSRTSVAGLARHVGLAWQNPNDQLFQANVRQEVLTGPRALGIENPAWWDHLFERFGLLPLLGRSPFRLSEGEKKRVAFASALAAHPEVLLLDEPTAGQDEPFRRELGSLIAELRAEGRAVVMVTHDLEFAAEHGSRWVALAEGRVVADGPPEVVMASRSAMARAGLRPTQRFVLLERLKQLNRL